MGGTSMAEVTTSAPESGGEKECERGLPNTLRTLQLLRDRIVAAESPEVFFGELDGEDVAKLAALNLRYFTYAKLCREGVDQTDPRAAQLANESSSALSELYRAAQERIRQRIYRVATATAPEDAESAPLATVSSSGRSYALLEVIADGDVALVYRGRYRDEKGMAHAVCLKIAKESADNELLENEREILQPLRHASIPKIIEGFTLPDGRGVNVLEFISGHTFHALREMATHAKGLASPDYHLGWILERQLSALGYLHSQGIIHGSVEPAHLLVQPQTHNVVLLDFCWAKKDPKAKEHIRIGQEYYSAPEVFAKAQPHPGMDLYGLGKSAVYLLGGEPGRGVPAGVVDSMFVKCLERMTEESLELRAKDAYQLAHHIVVIRGELSGERRAFLPLQVDATAPKTGV